MYNNMKKVAKIISISVNKDINFKDVCMVDINVFV